MLGVLPAVGFGVLNSGHGFPESTFDQLIFCLLSDLNFVEYFLNCFCEKLFSFDGYPFLPMCSNWPDEWKRASF